MQSIDAGLRAALLATPLENDVLTDFLLYIEGNPQTDTEELLIRFASDERWTVALVDLAGKTLEIGEEGLFEEFPDVCRMLVRQSNAQLRKDTVQNLKSSADPEAFKRFWSQRNQ